MGLLGSPSEKLIQTYRDGLVVIVPLDPLSFHPNHLKVFNFKSDRYQFLADKLLINIIPLKTSVISYTPYFAIKYLRSKPDQILFPTKCNEIKINFKPIKNEEIKVASSICNALETDLDPQQFELISIQLVSLDNIETFSNSTISPSITARISWINLKSVFDIDTSKPDIHNLNLKKNSFSYDKKRISLDKNSLDTTFTLQKKSVIVPRVTPLDPPRSLNKSKMKERLLWLLEPPIHEILSDPQLSLPYAPFPYQVTGIKWLYDRDSGLLADEMGLGKTMQSIIAAHLLWKDGSINQVLIICPKSLISNWRNELQTWWPGIESHIQVAEGDRRNFLQLGSHRAIVKIINYESLIREIEWIKNKQPHHDLIIIDEAQRIKNSESKTSKSVKLLSAGKRWALTGTPLENSEKDFDSILEFVRPKENLDITKNHIFELILKIANFIKSSNSVTDKSYISHSTGIDIRIINNTLAFMSAAKLINKSFNLEKLEKYGFVDEYWSLNETEFDNNLLSLKTILENPNINIPFDGKFFVTNRDLIKFYLLRRRQEDVLEELPEKIEQDIEIELGHEQREAYDRAENEGIFELNSKGDSITIHHVLALIIKLRQICNFDQVSGNSSKADFLIEDLEEILSCGKKALIFGQFVDERFGLKRLGKTLGESKIFSKRLQPLQLHGEVPPQRRQNIIDQFQNDPNCQVLLLNYSVGGVGLNLQAASYVFLFDRWWNPAVEDQAIKRSHRLGQKHKVIVKRFYCKSTIEQRILDILLQKRQLFKNVIEGECQPEHLGISEEEIFSLFNIKARPRRKN